jgi:hypothetical protein
MGFLRQWRRSCGLQVHHTCDLRRLMRHHASAVTTPCSQQVHRVHKNTVRVEGKRTTHSPCGGLEKHVWWDDKRHPLALERCVDGIQVIDPEPDMRDANLVGLNARPRRGRVRFLMPRPLLVCQGRGGSLRQRRQEVAGYRV